MTPITLINLVNTALARIGQNTITAVDDNTNEGRAVNRILDFVIYDVLSEHRWNGPTKRVKLAQLSGEPAFEFDHAYQLPSDFVRLAYTDEPEETYRIEGQKVLSDDDEVHISYVAFTQDPVTMGADCRKALSYKLSAELVQALTGDASRHQMMMRMYENALAEARYQDSQQEGISRIGGSSWLNARNSGGDSRSSASFSVGLND